MKLFCLMSLFWSASVAAAPISLRGLANSDGEQGHRELQANPAFIEANGIVSMQAESVPIQGDWKFESSNQKAGWTGTGYYRMNGNTVQTGGPNGDLEFYIKISDPGDYTFNIVSYKDHPHDRTWSNDCYVKFPHATDERKDYTKVFQSGPSFQWRTHTRYEFRNLNPHQQDPKINFPSAGTYLMGVAGRSKGYHIDRIFLFKNGKGAQAKDAPESARVGGASPPPPAPTPNPPAPTPNPPAPTPNPPASGNAAVTRFALIDATTDSAISGYGTLGSSFELNLPSLPTTQLNIRAFTSGSVGSVVFNLNGDTSTEGVAPYAMKGDKNGNYNGWTPAPGSYTLTATPYSGGGGSGTAGTSMTISFTVTNDATPPAPTPPAPTPPAPTPPAPVTPSPTPNPTPSPPASGGMAVTDFNLINADSDSPIGAYSPMSASSTLTLSSLPELNIQAVTSGSGIGSVVFDLNPGSGRTENVAPWALRGDVGGDYSGWTPAPGDYTLTATPYSGRNGSGSAGTSKTIEFTVV